MDKLNNKRLHKVVGIWLTGLPCSGKSTLARELEKELKNLQYTCKVLDGDELRTSINAGLGFSAEDRRENIRRAAEVSKLFLDSGIITINAFVSPTQELRTLARSIIGEDRFFEVFINAPVTVCIKRDIKGMYREALMGKIKNFTGIDSPYENPMNPQLIIETDELTIEQSLQKLVNYLLEQINDY